MICREIIGQKVLNHARFHKKQEIREEITYIDEFGASAMEEIGVGKRKKWASVWKEMEKKENPIKTH